MNQFQFFSIDRTEFQLVALGADIFQMKGFYFFISPTNYSWKAIIRVEYTIFEQESISKIFVFISSINFLLCHNYKTFYVLVLYFKKICVIQIFHCT